LPISSIHCDLRLAWRRRPRDDMDVDFRHRARARPELNAEIEHQNARGSTVLVETTLALGGGPQPCEAAHIRDAYVGGERVLPVSAAAPKQRSVNGLRRSTRLLRA
jgi:hypothetical protein